MIGIRSSDVIYAADFGVGEGGDESAALQKAITTGISIGTEIVLPFQKDITLIAPLFINGALRLNGNGARLKPATGITALTIDQTGAQINNPVIRNLRVQGGTTALKITGNGVLLGGRFDDLTFERQTYSGVSVSGHFQSCAFNNVFVNGGAASADYEPSALYGVRFDGTGLKNLIEFNCCNFRITRQAGLSMGMDGLTNGAESIITLRNTVIESNWKYGIEAKHILNLLIDSSHFENNGRAGNGSDVIYEDIWLGKGAADIEAGHPRRQNGWITLLNSAGAYDPNNAGLHQGKDPQAFFKAEPGCLREINVIGSRVNNRLFDCGGAAVNIMGGQSNWFDWFGGAPNWPEKDPQYINSSNIIEVSIGRLILRSPDNSRWKQEIDNAGVTSWMKL